MHRSASHVVAPFAVALVALAATGSAQDAGGKYATWSQVENAVETKDYRNALGSGGGAFDDKARAYVAQVALPQLGLEGNRATIERVRKRLRETLLGDIADEKAFDAASGFIANAMAALAGNQEQDPVVRVNAMLLIGELQAKDKQRLLPAAGATLAAAAGDARLPMEVRIAAASGLAKHADAAKAAGPNVVAALAKTTAASLTPMLSAPPDGGRAAAADWLAGRALGILQALGPAAASKESIDATARILGDPARAVDLRIRAAAALGAAAKPNAGFDAARAVESIRTVAISALEADEAAAEERRFAQSIAGAEGRPAGTPQPQGTGGEEPAIPQLVCRRDAWRLATCADAIFAEDGGSGLATLLGNDAAAAKSLAGTLRQAAAGLDANPDEQAVVEALALLGKPVAGAPAAGGSRPATPPGDDAAQPAQPAAGDAESPFESPFGK
jgi:hypothetical protein